MKIQKIILSILIWSLAVPVSAAVPLPMGWYIEGNVGHAKTDNVSYADNTSLSSKGTGWNLNAGYKFNPYFAAEIGYTNYADATAKYSGTEVAKDVHYSYDVTSKALLPIHDTGIELFAKLGVARLHSDVTVSNESFVNANGINVKSGVHSVTGYYVGIGADYTAWSNVAINTQWQRAKGNSRTGNLDLYSLGLSYLFG